MQRTASLLLLLGALLGIAGLAHASVWIAAGPARATLAVDAKGTAVVSVVSNGKHDTVVVPPKGQLYHGGSIGADVSRPTRVPGLPFALAVRRTPDGTRWALQRSQAAPDGPWDVHLARWSGAPTQLTLSFDGERLTGKASFHGKPVTGTIYTLEGKHPRIYVYLDCFAARRAEAAGRGCSASRRVQTGASP